MRGFIFTSLSLLTLCRPSFADEITLRMAAIAPDGTAWAREVRALSRDVANATNDQVHMRWYLGGIAGDEAATLARIRRGQLDGFAAASTCSVLAPVLNVTRVVGLVQSRAEGLHLLNELRKDIDDQMRGNGFIDLALGGFGNDVLFLRNPAHNLAEARKLPVWVWAPDELVRTQVAAMGFPVVSGEVDQVHGLFDSDQVHGMFVIPTAALAFQWTTRVHYFVDVRASYLPACMAVSQHAFDLLSFDQQQALRAASNKFAKRFEEAQQRDDALLLDSLFERQGLKKLPVSERFRDEFFLAAQAARAAIPARLVSPALMTRALTILGDFRGEHP